MRSFLVYVTVCLISFCLEGIMQHFPFTYYRIDLIWLLILYTGFFVPLVPGTLAVILMGLAQESVAVPFHGILLLPFLTIYFFIRATHRHLFFYGRVPQLLWVLILTLVQKGITFGLLAWRGYGAPIGFGSLFGFSLLNGVSSLLFFPLISKLKGLPEGMKENYGT